MKKEKNKLLRFAMLCMVLVLSASETWAAHTYDFSISVYCNPTGVGTVYAKVSSDNDSGYESNGKAIDKESEDQTSCSFDVKYADVQENYFFVGWSKGAAATAASDIKETSNPAAFSVSTSDGASGNVRHSATVYANFSRVKVQSPNNNYGYAKVNNFLLDNGNQATLSATTKEGCKFNGWLLNDATEPCSTDASYTFTVSDETAGCYTASFSVKTYSGLEVNSIGGRFAFYSDQNCSTELSDKPNPGATIYMKAIPDMGYTVGGIELTAAIGLEDIAVTPMESNPAILKMTLPYGEYEKVTITATFQQTQTATVSYVDEKYATKSVEAIVLDETMTELPAGFYVVPEEGLNLDHVIICNDDAEGAALTIIIPDGATLTFGTSTNPIGPADDVWAKCRLNLYGQTNATGKLVVYTSNLNQAISSNGYLAIAHIDVYATSAVRVYDGGTGCTIAGHQTKGNTVTVTGAAYGFNVPQTLNINNCNLDVEAGQVGIFVYDSSGTGLTITGKADGSNTVKVSVGNNNNAPHYGIDGANQPVTIKNCSVDITVEGNSGYGIYSDGARGTQKGVTIEGIAAGTNTVTVSSSGEGINGDSQPVAISKCSVDISSGNRGIYAQGLTIAGCETGTANLIKVNSTGSNNSHGIHVYTYPATITNCDVEMSSYHSSINVGGISQGLTITGRATGTANLIKLTSSTSDGIYFSGTSATITNCDVEVNSQGNGFNGGGSPLTITGRTTGTPNKIKVTTTGGNGFSLGGVTTTISDCDIEVNSGACGFTGGGGDLIITGRATGTPNQVSVTSSNDIGFQLGGVTTTINGCDVIVNSEFEGFNTGGNALTFTGRTTGTHNKIKVKSNNSHGIGGGGAPVNFSSCDVEMNGKEYGMYQSGGSFTFNNANVTVVGVKTAIHNSGGNPVVITDSKLTATCTGTYEEGGSTTDYCGIYAWGVNIDGSQVTVNAPNGYKGIYTYNSINLDWKHEDDFIYASSYGGNEYASIKAVHPFLDYYDDSKVYYGNISVTRDDNDYIISTPIDGVKLVPVGTAILSLDAGKFMTFYSDKHNLTVYDADIQLATITSVSGQTATATRIQNANKKMPFLIYNNSDETKEFILFPTDNVRWLPIYSGFKGTATDKTFSAAEMAATDHYILQDNAFYLVKNAGSIAAQRCWLEKAKSGNAASRLNIVFDEATGVNEVIEVNEVNDDTLYDLSGRKMVHGTSSNGTLKKGVFIQNGKKIIVK